MKSFRFYTGQSLHIPRIGKRSRPLCDHTVATSRRSLSDIILEAHLNTSVRSIGLYSRSWTRTSGAFHAGEETLTVYRASISASW
jgi:hypothetical protein